MPMKRRDRKNARVRRWIGRGAVGDAGSTRYFKLLRRDRRALEDLRSALASVVISG
jgi:hypothetical protein